MEMKTQRRRISKASLEAECRAMASVASKRVLELTELKPVTPHSVTIRQRCTLQEHKDKVSVYSKYES